MANQGRTIIMSIHQPRYSIYKLFDSLTLLVGGKMVYHGPSLNALDYFTNIGESITMTPSYNGCYTVCHGGFIIFNEMEE